ncbi:MAG: hypothetical protein II802_03855 [Clostridia bacterium]|nr:hypothetical protein [Clostridia bacterium]
MKQITIIGGDLRLTVAEKELREHGYKVNTIGLHNNDGADLSQSDIVVFPVPTSKDGMTVFAPLTDKKIYLDDIEKELNNSQTILTCAYKFKTLNCTDYLNLDSYSLLNAVPTAEGAIKIAIENTDFTLWKSKVLVAGAGRVGKILANRLKGMGADVTVSARKTSDFSLCEAMGLKHIQTNRINSPGLNYDIIFNTLDIAIISDENLKSCKARLIIDLSTKGGFNLSAAKDAGIKAIKAPGLPGKIAYETSGKILAQTILELI